MKNNTATNKLGKVVIRARFEVITDMVLNAVTLKHLMTFTWSNIPDRFIKALREAFSQDETRIDMRKNSTWEAVGTAIASYETLSSISEAVEPSESSRGTSTSTTGENAVEGQTEACRGTKQVSDTVAPAIDKQWHLDDPDWREERVMQMGEWHPRFRSTSTTGENAVEGQTEACRGTKQVSDTVAPAIDKQWHLDDPDWREERVMQMGEWHPRFRKVESQLKRRLHPFSAVLKDYATNLLSESTDDAEDLLRHLHEEVVTYLANKLVEAVDDGWREAVATVVRPDSPVWTFEERIEECRKMLA